MRLIERIDTVLYEWKEAMYGGGTGKVRTYYLLSNGLVRHDCCLGDGNKDGLIPKSPVSREFARVLQTILDAEQGDEEEPCEPESR